MARCLLITPAAMPRIPRNLIIEDNSTFHVTWQCHNKDWFLKETWLKRFYYRLLLKYKKQYEVKIYSYSFMSSHPHLTGFCASQQKLSEMMRVVNALFARQVNQHYQRFGQVVRDRFASPQIEDESHLLAVMMYVDANPVKAGMVSHPVDYKWSSYHYYANGRPDALVDPAPVYLALGTTDVDRQRAYRRHVKSYLEVQGLVKKNYSSAHAIGNPLWVLNREGRIRDYFRNHSRKNRQSLSTEQPHSASP